MRKLKYQNVEDQIRMLSFGHLRRINLRNIESVPLSIVETELLEMFEETGEEG